MCWTATVTPTSRRSPRLRNQYQFAWRSSLRNAASRLALRTSAGGAWSASLRDDGVSVGPGIALIYIGRSRRPLERTARLFAESLRSFDGESAVALRRNAFGRSALGHGTPRADGWTPRVRGGAARRRIS